MSISQVTIEKTTIEEDSRIAKFTGASPDEVETSEVVQPAGVDSAPLKGMIAVKLSTGADDGDSIIGYINVHQKSKDGEIRLFAVDTQDKEKTYIWLTNGGFIELAGTGDNAVRYAELKKGFDDLKQAHNDLVNAFNTHMHATAGTGPPVPPTPGSGIPAVVTTADISSSKIEEIKVPAKQA